MEDTIIGKAAAILICRLGIKKVKVGTLSRLGEAVFKVDAVPGTNQGGTPPAVDLIRCIQ